MTDLLGVLEEGRGALITYHVRPMATGSVERPAPAATRGRGVAIVLQGPVRRHDAFTLQTLDLYRRHYGDAKLILSTWREEEARGLEEFRRLGVEVVLCDPPEYSGESHINHQIVSSRQGVRRARELGAEWVMKTRTDQRMYAAGVDAFLIRLLELHPPRGGFRQEARIAGMSLNTFLYRLYGLTDMLVFGRAGDMESYWSPPLDERRFTDEDRARAGRSLGSFARWRVCEVYLATEFLQKTGRELAWTLEDSWRAFAEQLLVIDKEPLDLAWPKYNRLEHRWLTYGEGSFRTREMGFLDWLLIASDLDRLEVPEEILKR